MPARGYVRHRWRMPNWRTERMSKQTSHLPDIQSVMSFLEQSVKDPDHLDQVTVSRSLTRDNFFSEACWAILVAAVSTKVAHTWEKKAETTGFPLRWKALSKWNTKQFNQWCKAMASTLTVPRKDLVGTFRDRWWAIWDLACWLADFAGEKEFGSIVDTCGIDTTPHFSYTISH